jgi:hypothetical protein
VSEVMTPDDHFAALGERKDKPIWFSESERRGRAASATLREDGSYSYSLTGPSPQGEEDTGAVCEILVRKLNSAGGDWKEPTGSQAGDDGEAVDRQDAKRILRIQVVRAIVDQELWQKCARARKIEGAGVSKEELARQMKAAIEAKADVRKIPVACRRGLVLALDANRLPVLGFDTVVEEFRSRFGGWTRALGFDSVWLVGPDAALTRRLDKTV